MLLTILQHLKEMEHRMSAKLDAVIAALTAAVNAHVSEVSDLMKQLADARAANDPVAQDAAVAAIQASVDKLNGVPAVVAPAPGDVGATVAPAAVV
jgi:hypothetical protein